MANGNGTAPIETKKRRGRPAGSKNKASYIFGSIQEKKADNGLSKFLTNALLKEFFSLPQEVQDSVKTLMQWEEESSKFSADDLGTLFE